MSIPVDLDRLAATVAGYRFAYLLTTGEDRRPHAVQVSPVLDGDRMRVAAPGRRSSANARTQPAVALIWPPAEDGGYTLIVDGEAALEADALTLTPTRAVLHRPAGADFAPAASSCGSDCVELAAPSP